MVPLERFMLQLLGQSGDRYVFGAEADLLDPDPDVFDCSELIQWAGARCRVTPPIPDGSSAQWEHVRRYRRISVETGVKTRGALLWRPGHVAISTGDGRTIEARGRLYGVGRWASAGRFQGSGMFPGIDYRNPGTPLREENELNADQAKQLKELHEVLVTGKREAWASTMLKTLRNHTDKLLDKFKIPHSG